MKMLSPVRILLIALVLVGLSGVARAADAVTTSDLKQIGLAYHNHHDATGKGPDKAKDLAPYFENSKKLLDHLESGRIKFFYGVRITDMTEGTSNTILAHEQDVPTKGGLVLMGDGSVRKITAEEFKKVAKAKPKK